MTPGSAGLSDAEKNGGGERLATACKNSSARPETKECVLTDLGPRAALRNLRNPAAVGGEEQGRFLHEQFVTMPLFATKMPQQPYLDDDPRVPSARRSPSPEHAGPCCFV